MQHVTLEEQKSEQQEQQERAWPRSTGWKRRETMTKYKSGSIVVSECYD